MADWNAQYREKLITKEALAARFKPGDVIQLGVWYGEPYGMMRAIEEYCGDVDPLFVFANFTTSPSQYYQHKGVHLLTAFQGPNERAARGYSGQVSYVPIHFTDCIDLVQKGRPYDYFIHRVTPMDERGMVNFSMTCSWEYRALKWIKENRPETTIVFEVNPKLPRVCGIEAQGNNELSIDYADVIVEDDTPILDYPIPPPNEVEKGIAANVAALVPDGATLQLGFGTIPMAIGAMLSDRKDLGIHTEMFCEAHLDLIESGSVTNAKKGLYDGVSVGTFALGTKRLHDFMRENRECVMLPVEAVNGLAELAKVKNLTAVNSVLTVDATGQACAHCLGPHTYSGLGGAFEFAFGARLSRGGQSVSCLPSTTALKDGRRISNIVARHPEGTRVTLPEHSVDWVVTEFGAARLRFLTLEQRAAALIEIAHPDFREQLAQEIRDGEIRLDAAGELPEPPAHFYSKA